MCRSSFLACSLALCFVSSPLHAGGWLLDQSSKADILMTLDGLESNLQTLRTNLAQASETVTRLDGNLAKALSDLATSESNLQTAKQKLADSEAKLTEVQESLTTASQALKESEESFRAYQQSEVLRIGGWSLGALAIGLLIGFFAPH